MNNEPDSNGANAERNEPSLSAPSSTDIRSRSLHPRPSLSRGFDSYVQPQGNRYGVSDTAYHKAPPEAAAPEIATDRADHQPQLDIQQKQRRFAWRWPWQARQKQPASRQAQSTPREPLTPFTREAVTDRQSHPNASSSTDFTASDAQWPHREATGTQQTDAVPLPYAPLLEPLPPTPLPPTPLPRTPRFWQRQPYVAIAYLLTCSGALTLAWLFGILLAQIFSGNISAPPLQERLLRKTSRLSNRLWHFPELWHTPTAQSRIEAIPLPETGPVLEPLVLPPLEKQPLVDELNSIETELLTLDRRLQTLEKRLGKPPYQGTGISARIDALRAAVDPPPLQLDAVPSYQPVATTPDDHLLEVAQLKITLPSDALFSPGQSDLKADSLLSQVLDQLVNYPDATISIRSYSDDQVDTSASRDYTLIQANTLATYLRKSLPDKHRWVTVGMGQTQPVIDNVDPVARQKNRRIEILVDTR